MKTGFKIFSHVLIFSLCWSTHVHAVEPETSQPKADRIYASLKKCLMEKKIPWERFIGKLNLYQMQQQDRKNVYAGFNLWCQIEPQSLQAWIPKKIESQNSSIRDQSVFFTFYPANCNSQLDDSNLYFPIYLQNLFKSVDGESNRLMHIQALSALRKENLEKVRFVNQMIRNRKSVYSPYAGITREFLEGNSDHALNEQKAKEAIKGLQALNVDQGRKIVGLLDNLNACSQTVLFLLMDLEYLASRNLPGFLEFLDNQEMQQGISFAGSFGKLHIGKFIDVISMPGVWKDEYSVEDANKFEADFTAFLEKEDQLPPYAYIKTPHGAFSHRIQTLIQSISLDFCLPHPFKSLQPLKNLRKSAYANAHHLKVGDMTKVRRLPGNYIVFWRNLNDRPESEHVFGNAHFLTYLAYLVSPTIAKFILYGKT